jgi:hypothetical protein
MSMTASHSQTELRLCDTSNPLLNRSHLRCSADGYVIVDSRSCPSAPTCFGRGFNGGKKIKGIKIHLAVDKYGFPLAVNVSAANMHDSKGIVPVLHQLAGRGFKETPWVISEPV